MKTFLGFTTGLLSGTILGAFFMALMWIVDKQFRDICVDIAES